MVKKSVSSGQAGLYGRGGAEPAALRSVAFFTAPHPLQLQMHLHFLFCGHLLCLRIFYGSHSHYSDLPSGKPTPHHLNTQLLFRSLTLVFVNANFPSQVAYIRLCY